MNKDISTARPAARPKRTSSWSREDGRVQTGVVHIEGGATATEQVPMTRRGTEQELGDEAAAGDDHQRLDSSRW